MLRRLAAAVVIVAMARRRSFAQNAVITVTAASADVHKSPSTGSPVIGHTARGAQLPVTRELGSWVRVEWPSAPDGIGFVHVSMGRVVNGRPPEQVRAAAGDAVKAIPEKTAALTPPAASATVADRTPARRPSPSTPVPHLLGIGGGMLAASPVGFGVTARAWRWNRLGIRFDMSRQSEGRGDRRPCQLAAVRAERDRDAERLHLELRLASAVCGRGRRFPSSNAHDRPHGREHVHVKQLDGLSAVRRYRK